MPILLVQDQYVDSDVNPVWNYEAHFPVEQPNGLTLQLEVLSNNHSSCPFLWLHIFLQRISPSALLPALFAKFFFWSFRCLTLMLALTTTFLVKPHWKCQRWWRMDLLRFPSLSIETHCDGVESCLWNVKLFWRRTGSHWKRRNTEPSTWSVFGDPS